MRFPFLSFIRTANKVQSTQKLFYKKVKPKHQYLVCNRRRGHMRPYVLQSLIEVDRAIRLPGYVMSANSLSAFQQQLKHALFQQSFPNTIM